MYKSLYINQSRTLKTPSYLLFKYLTFPTQTLPSQREILDSLGNHVDQILYITTKPLSRHHTF